MKAESLPNYKNAVYDLDITVNDPDKGFRFHLMETGASSESMLVSFSGHQGYLFDQSGNFFGGYDSGIPFELLVHYDHDNESFSYYHEKVLMANDMRVTGSAANKIVNDVRFDPHNGGSLSLFVSGVKS